MNHWCCQPADCSPAWLLRSGNALRLHPDSVSHPGGRGGWGLVLFVCPAGGSQLVWLCAGLWLGLSIFDGHLGRPSLPASGGGKSSGCRGNFSHGLCAERKGLFSVSQV